MPRLTPYLHRRGDSFSFRIAVPSELRAIVGKREFIKTLQTTDKRCAIPLALHLASIAKQIFNNLKTNNMSDSDREKLMQLLREEKAKIPLRRKIEEKEEEIEELKNRAWQERRQIKLEAAKEMSILKAENEAFKLALASFQGSGGGGATSAEDSALDGLKTATKAIVSTKKRMPHKLSEAISVWCRLKNPALSTIEVYKAAVDRFEGHFPELYAGTIEKRHIREYIAWLQSEKKSPKTIEKEHGALRALLSIAEHEGWIESNPAKGILLPVLKGKKVRSFTPEECKKIFDSPVFVSGERPIAGKGEAAFWIPLLMLFTGARREEICQLTTERIKKSGAVSYLLIDPIDDEGRLKTEDSKRAIPIHNQLLKIGFLSFIQEQAKAGGGQLFPLLKPNKRGQYGAKWGDWWGRYIRQTIGITDERISPAHSFRHLFITECRRLGFREDYERALVGHAGGSRKDSHDDYGEHLIPSLAAELNRIDFRGLDLSHLYKKDCQLIN
jgi:integrase